LFVGGGFYRFNDKWKQRGLGKLKGKEIETIDTFEKNGKLYYRFIVNRSSRLRLSIIQDQISEIGKIKPYIREIDLNADRKRFWLNSLKEINHECNDSVPISLNHFAI